MADKLSESSWTGFTKKSKLDVEDKALVKALAKFDKTDAAKPEPRLGALKDLVEQLNKQIVALAKVKKALGDKPFALAKDQLNELLELAEDEQKKTQAALLASESDDEPDTSALLTTKMVPLLREVRKGQVQMHALICTAGKETSVLIMRRAIAPARRKLLAQAVNATGGMRYFPAECMFEDKMLTFVVKAQVSRMAKRLRQALLDQTELRFKVKVRGDDGVEEEDGEDGGDDGAADAGAAPGTPGNTAAQSAAKPPPGGQASAEQIAYVQQLRKLRESYEQTLKGQHPNATRLRALMGFANEKAAAKDYAAAIQALRVLDKALAAPVHSDDAKASSLSAAQAAAAKGFAQQLKVVLTSAKAKSAQLGAAAVKHIAQQAAAAQAAAKAGEINRANELLEAIEAAVNSPSASTSKPGATTRSDRQTQQERQIRQRLAAIQGQIDTVQDAGGRSSAELRRLRHVLDGQLGAGGFERAALLLERIERLLSEAEQEHRQFRNRLAVLAKDLASSEQEVANQVAALEKALQASEDEELRLIGEAGLGWMLGEHGARLKSLLKQLLQAQPSERGKAADRALQGVGAYLDHLESSEEIAACDGNDLGVEVSIRATLAFALDPMGATLAEI